MTWAWLALAALLLATATLLALVFSELWRVHLLRGVPSVSSTWSIVDRVIAERVFPRSGLILDLGAGTGWVLRRLFRRGVDGPLVGYELALFPWLIAVAWNAMLRMPVRIRREDFFRAPIDEASGIYLFLLPRTLETLAPHLRRLAKHGCVIVSAEFPLPGWTPTRTLEARGITRRMAKIYVYRA